MKFATFLIYSFLLVFLSCLSKPVSSDEVTVQEESLGQILTFENGAPMTTLSNGKTIPLVGLGVGNTQHYLVPLLVASGVQDNKRVRLIDTTHASDNERLIAEGINQGMKRFPDGEDKVTIHVVTKVWYTHLGYERTKLSVKNSFENLKAAIDNDRVDLKVHVLINWPRCYNYIEWMNCEEDENALSDEVKSVGPAPHKSKKDAWQSSWKALEDLYESQEYGSIESIGVSNFNMMDMQEFLTFARVMPHLLQINVWSLLYDPILIDFCQQQGIHVQAFNVMSIITVEPEKAPHAYHHLQRIAQDLSEDLPDELTPAQVVLAWLIQHGVSVIPRTSRLSRLEENSAVALTAVPEMSDYQVETVAHCVEAYLSGDDIESDLHISLTFEAQTRDLMLFWKRHDGTEVHVAYIQKGESFNETTYPKHNYVVYDALNKDSYVKYQVQGRMGEHQTIPF
jgi:diketogulonate reductase-like aldo/keto reductase